MVSDSLDHALDEVTAQVKGLKDNTVALRDELHEERMWRKWATVALGVAFAGIIAVGVFAGLVLHTVSRTTAQIEDCANPRGECYRRQIELEEDRREAAIARSNEIVEGAISRLNQQAADRIRDLEVRLTEKIEATHPPTTLAGRRTPTTTRSSTVRPPITTVPIRPNPTTTNPPPRPNTPPGLLCTLLRIGC